jgi:hypothetical protein
MTASDLQQWVEQIKRGLDKPVQGPPEDSGDKLKDAVKRRLHPAGGIFGSVRASANDNSFAERLRKAVKQHPKSKERAQKAAEKEHARYPKPHRRQPTRSD